MRLRLLLPALLAFTLACGGGGALTDLVPTPAGYQARLDALVGKPINVAVAELGAPTRTVDLAAGSKLYVWEEKSELRTAMHGTERYDPQTRTEHITITAPQRVPLDCFTELEADASGVVTRNRAQGVACIGLPPGPGYAAATTAAVTPPVAAPIPVPAPAPVPAPPPVAPPAAADVASSANRATATMSGAAAEAAPAAEDGPRAPQVDAERRERRRAERAAARRDRQQRGE